MGNDRARSTKLEPITTRARSPLARRLVGVVVVATLLGGAIAYGKQRTDRDLDRVVADLHQADRELVDARIAVEKSAVVRRRTETTLDATLRRLEKERRAHRQVRAYLDAMGIELVELRQELRLTSSDVERRAQRLAQLNQCLTGVAQAMKEAAYDADSRVVETLKSVADVCAEARGVTGAAR